MKENLFMKECKILKLKDCISQLNTGLNPRQNFSLGNGSLRYITAKNLNKFGTIDFTKCDFIDEKAKDIIHKRSDIQIGDILFSSRAPVGHCHLIQNEPDYYDIGESIFSIRVNPNIVLPEYMCLYLSSDYFVKSASNYTTGSVIQEIRIANLMNMDIIIPTKDVQKKISNIIIAISKKIENNYKINNNLEELAYTIFLHDFANKTANGTIGDIIKENEKSKIKVGDAKDIKGEYPFFTSGESILEWNDYLTDGRNLFLNTGGNADVKFYVGKATYSTDTWCITFKNEMSDYLYLYLKAIKNELDRKFFHGSGLKHLQKPLFKQEKIYIPKQEELRRFNIQVKTMFDTISSNKRENQRLNSLKEYLLPLLMNGQINVDDIEI